eukprot:gene4309-7665_t
MSSNCDVLVVGGGIIGSSTAYSLTKRNVGKVVLIEQFEFLHKNGSSHGNTRIYRQTYPVQLYSDMCVESLKLWKEAEQKSKIQVYHQTGGLDFGDKSNQTLLNTINVCKDRNIPHEVLDSKMLSKQYPQLKVDSNWIGIHQKDAGILNASEAVRMFLHLAQENRCELHENEKVLEIFRVSDNRITVKTTKNTYHPKKVVLCCGAWSQKILSALGLKINFEIWRCCYTFWKFEKEYQDNLQKEKFPLFIYFGKNDEFFYGFPCFEYKDRLKASMHYSNDIIDPDQNNRKPSPYILDRSQDFMKNSFKGLKKDSYEKSQSETCLYTITDDENFIIDHHPRDKDIVMFSGGSGHGFKFGSLMGEILSDLLEEKTSSFDLSMFSIDRFEKKMQNKGPSMLRNNNEQKSKL